MAWNSLQIIVSRLGTMGNYDPTNKLSGDDLLYLVALRLSRNYEDFLPMLIVQLEDLSTGSCPQGVSHRLFQILKDEY